MRERLELVRDVLDTQIVDADETKMGRADGIVLAIDGDGPPRVDHLELGFAVLARRLHPRLEQWLQNLRERWSVDQTWNPQMDAARREELYAFWKKAVTRSFDWL